jgi:hypothetical protein
MFVRIAQLFEDGRPLPRHRSITAQPVRIGKLSFFEQHDVDFRRSMVYATLCEPATGRHVVPRLYDAVVRWISDGCMTVSGFERDEATKECKAQSWYIQVINDAESDSSSTSTRG